MGTIHFYSGNNATGTNFYTINDTAGQSINLKSMSGKNDVARSLKLVNAITGVVIKVYDSPDASTSDDWAEIEVLKQVPDCVVGTFERTYTDPDGVYRQTFHRNNGLDGKVSHVKTVAAPPLQLDYVALGKLFAVNGWNDKGGSACRFNSQNSYYRIYQPDTAPALGSNGAITGTIITAQLDNDRPSTDDHCYIKLEIGLDGMLATTLEFTWGNTSKKAQYAAKAAAWVANQIINLALKWPASKMVDLLFNVAGEVTKVGLALFDPEGRVNFNAVVNHSINKIVQATRATSG